ncbi:MAG TPA: DUF424 family protein [Candidatus Nanoarchaeia archaeon]|nr:DUF424 family protein [Candidatus Nanoarchaeia archaeon]
MEFIVASKKSVNGDLLIITDKSILGQKFSEGKLQLDLNSKFYSGTEKNEPEVLVLIPKARHLHFTGSEAVKLALKIGLIDPYKILYVQGVPHAQVVMEG